MSGMSNSNLRTLPPILRDKHTRAASAFTPQNLLREARRQKGIPDTPVPEVCVLDPDGDIVRYLHATGRARPVKGWACYHSAMDRFEQGGREYGIIGCAVGSSYAVLVAEQMFASGCRLLLSITSSGQITALRPPPYFILIERALRDEGTSYHYLLAADYAEADPVLVASVGRPWQRLASRSSAGRHGRPMRPTGKPPRPSRRHGRRAFWRSRWKRQRSTPSRKRAVRPCSASRTLPIRWGKLATSRRARPTEPPHRSLWFMPWPRLGYDHSSEASARKPRRALRNSVVEGVHRS